MERQNGTEAEGQHSSLSGADGEAISMMRQHMVGDDDAALRSALAASQQESLKQQVRRKTNARTPRSDVEY